LLQHEFLELRHTGSHMSEESAIDNAVKRLAHALDALDAAVERRREADRSEEALAAQVHVLGLDRTKLANALDGETARAKKLEETNREIAQRLDTAIASIQSVLDSNE
jgi:prefoldin subunit 5